MCQLQAVPGSGVLRGAGAMALGLGQAWPEGEAWPGSAHGDSGQGCGELHRGPMAMCEGALNTLNMVGSWAMDGVGRPQGDGQGQSGLVVLSGP